MQSYNIRHVYVDRIQESILFREVSRYFFRGHHLYDENFVPIKPIQYHGRGAFRLKPSTDPNHPPYPTTINGGVHDSNHFLSETQEGVYTLWWWSTGASDEQRARDTTADAASLRRAGIGGGHSCYGCWRTWGSVHCGPSEGFSSLLTVNVDLQRLLDEEIQCQVRSS